MGWLMATVGATGVAQHQVDFLTKIGFPAAAAGSALGGVGIGSTVGKFGFGWLSDHLAAKYCSAISFSFMAVGIVIVLSVGPASPLVMIWAYAILVGLGIGGWAPLISVLVAGNYGLASYGAIYGTAIASVNMGNGSGPLILGYMFDAMQTYYPAFIVALALCAVAIPTILAVHRPKLRLASSG